MAAAQPGALPSNTIAHIPALSAFIRILSSSGYSFTRSSNGFIWSRLSRKKMRRRPFLLPPCPSLSFHFRFHLRPFNTGGGLACRPPPPSACTGWLSAGSWTWSIGPLGRGRLVGGEIHSEYQDQAALAAPAGLTGQDAKGKKAIGYN